MRSPGLVLTLVALAAFPAVADDPKARVKSLDWMTGTWSESRNEEVVTEAWVGPANGLMAAVNVTALPGGRHTFEHLRIIDTDEGFSYLASPSGRAPVEFKLKEQGDRRVVFENPAKEFPRRILYWREGEFLKARIEGVRGNRELKEEWTFARVR
jgi:hypothetical protein